MLAWMDLEMTGLDPERCVILEIAAIVTDDELETVAELGPLVLHATDEELAVMEPVVVQMHSANHLLEDVRRASLTIDEAESTVLAFLKAHLPDPHQVPLCGNSIGTDRRFLARHMPKVEALLHYRSIDVSSLKELARRWYPEVIEHMPQKNPAHRALDDVRDSIAELRYYRSSMLRPREGGQVDARGE
ncbi:Exonuclease RNase T and DNA polymerase III [Acidimicrobium ferrooxidans DSM 10331]|uniref:Exonuclease RNase T and DNA polymerase III n=1 Tax=Acidimicrobium ferrooxidans (strain DSM 10331 / JCM 15462 / NBRC 103882 / ICP) TaxID=525909 RepID=C7LYK0_ACIFD|nr:oligoribonuclease [Acidimicrobium ferrooxidans]ACU53808.1 Exonuclease RNase T and DNA polymerase III [Acidimicrobium ferrooxidans DSM 10331]